MHNIDKRVFPSPGVNLKRPPHVVIVGGGFGGIETAKRLAKAPLQITLVDRHNYHLFQPLLYQVAIAGLVPSQIAYPIRTIFRGQRNLNFQMGDVTEVNLKAGYLKMNGSVLAYDYLVLAPGGKTNFFGMHAVEEKGFQLKSVESATAVRNHLLQRFERASREVDTDRRRALLTFVIVGGGPTGVETAGALAELIRLVLSKDYPRLDLADCRVVLLEAAGHLMANYPERLRKATLELLRSKGVDVQLATKVADYDGEEITLGDGNKLPAQTLIWTAGVRASDLMDRLGVPQAALGRVPVEPTLQLPGYPGVFIIGDAGHLEDVHGQPLPMLATVAQQQARATAENIIRMVEGRAPQPFRYRDPGLLATIGRNAAVARIAGLSFSGFPAWVIWVGLHIFRLIGFRNRLVVMMNWAWDYFFYDNQVRLITRE
jgi:NADH dehydrogenase